MRRTAQALLLLAVGGALAYWTWGTWLDAYIDFGRELYVPWQIVEGRQLYRDLAHLNGPLSQYLNAALFAIFGVGLRTLVVANLLVLAGVAWLLFGWVRELSDSWTATLATALYLFVFCFGQLDGVGNFNWVCPYSHEMTHGIALTLLMARALLRWGGARGAGRGATWLALGGFCLGLVFLTKPELFAAALLTSFVALGLTWIDARPGAGRCVRQTLAFAAAASVPVGAAFLLLLTSMSAQRALHGVLGGWNYVFDRRLAELPFYKTSMGTDDPVLRLTWMAACAVVWLLVLGPGYVLATRLADLRGRRLVVALGAGVATFALGGLAVLFAPFAEPVWRYAYLALPLALVAICVARVRDVRRAAPGQRERQTSALVFVALALGLLLKILCNARVSNYGFGLALPAFVLAFLALFHWLPMRIQSRGGSGAAFRIVVAAILALIVLVHGMTFRFWEGYRTRELGQGADRFRTDDRADALSEIVRRLEREPADTTVLVLPEGVMINYLARRRNPTPYINFMPPELIAFGVERMREAFGANRPDFVVLLARITREYGQPLFGRDYGAPLLAWVKANYVPELRLGPEPLHPDRVQDRKWGAWLLARRD